jgi:hypothetical protein
VLSPKRPSELFAKAYDGLRPAELRSTHRHGEAKARWRDASWVQNCAGVLVDASDDMPIGHQIRTARVVSPEEASGGAEYLAGGTKRLKVLGRESRHFQHLRD